MNAIKMNCIARTLSHLYSSVRAKLLDYYESPAKWGAVASRAHIEALIIANQALESS